MFLYSIAIKIYIFFIYLAAPFYAKAGKAIAGRRNNGFNFFNTNEPQNPTDKFIWFHCASLGEFEQGRPLIEKIKKEHPSKKILLSFFSPSGYEIRKDHPDADLVIYLPFDSSSNARKFISHFNIEMAVFVKYDIWPFYIRELLKNKIPVFLISAIFRKEKFFFKWYGAFVKKMMMGMNKIFVQDENSKKIAELNGLTNVLVAGDVRIDRVLEIKNNPVKLPELTSFLQETQASSKDSKYCIVFGSIYKSDEPVIDFFIENAGPDCKIIIAPHNVDETMIHHLQKKYINSLPACRQGILYSDLENYNGQQILIVNNIGKLNSLYQFADLVYIGGGYGGGIHNTLEPAVFNIPVFFGPKFKKFPEAKSFINEKLAFFETTPIDLAKTMIYKLKKNRAEEKSSTGRFLRGASLCGGNKFVQKSKNWFQHHSGATDLIFSYLSHKF